MDQLKTPEQLSLEQAMQGPSDDRFSVTCKDDVVWALSKIEEIEEKKAGNQEMVNEAVKPYQRKIEQAEDWLKKSNAKLDESISHYTGLIREYTDPKQEEKATYKLETPKGNISYRKKQATFRHDDSVLIKSVPDEFIKTETVKKVKWGDYKKAIKDFPTQNGKIINPETGEIIKGVEVEKPARREFTITPIKEDK